MNENSLDEELGYPVFRALQFVVNILQTHPYKLDDGNDESAKCQGTQMVPYHKVREEAFKYKS